MQAVQGKIYPVLEGIIDYLPGPNDLDETELSAIVNPLDRSKFILYVRNAL